MKNPEIDEAVKKLKESNQELKITLEQLHEQFEDIRKDPRFKDSVNDLEDLCMEYLKTWISTNKEVINLLGKNE